MRSSKSILPIDCAPDETGHDPGRGAGPEALEQEAGKEKGREMVQRERPLQAVDGDVAVGPESAHVVDQDVEPRVRRQHAVGQVPQLILRRHVRPKASTTPPDWLAISAAAASVRTTSRPVMPTLAPMDARRTAVARPIPPVPPVTSAVLPVIGPMLSPRSAVIGHLPRAAPSAGRRWTRPVRR